MDGLEVADPYVERLLEGFAFLAARVQLKLDAEYPRFIAHLLETLYPNFLAPVPSMMVVRLHPDSADPTSRAASRCARGSRAVEHPGTRPELALRVPHRARRQAVADRDRRAAQYFSHAPDLPLAQLPEARQIRGGLRIALARCTAACALTELPLDRAAVPLSAPATPPGACTSCSAAPRSARWCGPWDRRRRRPRSWRDARGSIGAQRLRRRRGAAARDAARLLGLPPAAGVLAALPQRFLFFDLSGLRAAAGARRRATRSRSCCCSRRRRRARSAGRRGEPGAVLHAGDQPVRQAAGPHRGESRRCGSSTRCPTAARPMDFEVHSIESVTGHGTRPRRRSASCRCTRASTRRARSRTPTSRCGASRACCRSARRRRGRARRYVGRRCSSRWSIRRTRRSRTTCASSRSTRWCTQPRPAAAAAARSGAIDDADLAWRLDGAAAVQSVQLLRGPTRPRRAQRARRHRLGARQPPDAQLPVAGRRRPATRRAALRACCGCTAAGRTRPGSARSRACCACSARRSCAACRIRGPLTFGPASRSTLEVDELAFQGAQRLPARQRARTLLRAPCGDQHLHRDGAAIHHARRAHALAGARRRAARESVEPPSPLAASMRCCTTFEQAPFRARLLRAAAPHRSAARGAAAARPGAAAARRAAAHRPGCRARLRARRDLAFERQAPTARRGWACASSACSARMGPLPLHLTEYARERERHHGDAGAARASPTSSTTGCCCCSTAPGRRRSRRWSYDRPRRRRASRAGGRAVRPCAAARARARRASPDDAKRYPSPASSRAARASPKGLAEHAARATSGCRCASSPTSATGCRCAPRTARASAAGQRASRAQRAGRSAVAGDTVWDRQYEFRITLGPADAARTTGASCPAAARSGVLRDWVRQYVGLDLRLGRAAGAAADDVPALAARRAAGRDAARLGWHEQVARAGARRAPSRLRPAAGVSSAALPSTSRVTETAMTEISRAALFGKLNPLAYKAIEGATVFCKLRGNPYVELVHWLHQILQLAGLATCTASSRHFELDASALAADLTARARPPAARRHVVTDLSTHVEDAVERGWVYGSLLFGESAGAHRPPAGRHAEDAVAAQRAAVDLARSSSASRSTTWPSSFGRIARGSPEDAAARERRSRRRRGARRSQRRDARRPRWASRRR